jgi:hypothetical protein
MIEVMSMLPMGGISHTSSDGLTNLMVNNSIVTFLQAGARNVVLRTTLLLVSRKNIVLSF